LVARLQIEKTQGFAGAGDQGLRINATDETLVRIMQIPDVQHRPGARQAHEMRSVLRLENVESNLGQPKEPRKRRELLVANKSKGTSRAVRDRTYPCLGGVGQRRTRPAVNQE